MTDFANPNWTTYSVDGNKLADVANAISGRDEAGETTWHPTFTYQTGDDGLVSSATVTVTFDVQVPEWSGRANASNAEGAEWDRWIGALNEHEQGHVDSATAAFEGLDEQMIGKSANDAQALFDAAEAKAQADSDAYDAGNGHGTTATNSTNMQTEFEESETDEGQSQDGTYDEQGNWQPNSI